MDRPSHAGWTLILFSCLEDSLGQGPSAIVDEPPPIWGSGFPGERRKRGRLRAFVHRCGVGFAAHRLVRLASADDLGLIWRLRFAAALLRFAWLVKVFDMRPT